MGYAAARLREKQETAAYRIYVTDAVRIVTENTAKLSGGGYIMQRFAEILNPALVDNRTGDEIAADVIKKAGLEVVDSGSNGFVREVKS